MLHHVLTAIPMANLPNPTPTQPPGTDKLNTLINWGAWIVLFACLVGFFVSVAKLVQGAHTGREMDGMRGLVLSLVGCILVGAAGGIVAAITG